ncbi:RagB/SusD family nutrient uptake outer membrane protein, partial [Bacteroides finegoldii]
ECVQWITEEFTDLIENSPLPLKSEGETYARMNRGIAKAYLARILLQSASPQFNGNSKYANIRNADGTPLFPLTYDKNKWELARQAALSLIKDGNYDLVKVLYESGANMGEIDPYTSYKSVFTTSQNKEMIFSFLEDNGTIDKRLAPNSNGGWGGGYNPTQEIVDAYAMLETGRFPITGYTDDDRTTPIIDPDAGYQEVGYSQFTNPCEGKERKTYNMFVGREPRFYVSIVYGGMSWFIPKKASEKIYLEMYKNGNNGPDASHNHFTTGYNMVKLAMPEYEASPTKNVKRELPYIRYAEILLNYVEATIELGELKDPNLLTYWNAVRNRAGLKNIEEAYPEAMNDQDKLRDLIHRERRVEFAFEGINFYDSRRWLTAEETEKGDIHGMNIQAKGTPGKEEYPEDFFQRTVIEKRVFTPSFYLFPIPQSAINKNQDLVQNYKW